MSRRAEHRGALLRAWLPAALLVLAAGAQQPTAAADLCAAVARKHADWCHGTYRECEQRARDLERAVANLLGAPGPATLEAARAAWCAGRAVYGRTEVCRFHDGPIEALEPLLNAWPLDEAYVDAVRGQPEAGIIQDRARFPRLGETVLMLANERGGEANISTGWHAIEFLLWGQDLDADGPGARPATDFVPGAGHNADRRREYLQVVTALLVRHLGELRQQWAPDADNYRRRFEADPEGAVRRMLTGAVVLTAFELHGERLAVAYETQDQEQEHSCFSDTTHLDLVANQRGIEAVCVGDGGGQGLLALVARRDEAAAAGLRCCLAATTAALQAIPAPFDRAFRGDDDAPGRAAIRAAMAALDAQTDALLVAGRLLGFELPLKPGG